MMARNLRWAAAGLLVCSFVVGGSGAFAEAAVQTSDPEVVAALGEFAGYKLAVGSYQDLAQELKRLKREQVPLPALGTASTVPCRADQNYYVMWQVAATDPATVGGEPQFEVVWQYPHHPKDGFERAQTRFPVPLTDGQSEPMLMETNLVGRPLANGNISVSVKDEWGLEVISHTFAVRGCKRTGQERPEASVAVHALGRDVDLVCANEREVGTRVRKRICRTKAQIEMERQWAQSELRRRQGLQPPGG